MKQNNISETEFISCYNGKHILFYTGKSNSIAYIVFKNSNNDIFTGFMRPSDNNMLIDFVIPPVALFFAHLIQNMNQ